MMLKSYGHVVRTKEHYIGMRAMGIEVQVRGREGDQEEDGCIE